MTQKELRKIARQVIAAELKSVASGPVLSARAQLAVNVLHAPQVKGE